MAIDTVPTVPTPSGITEDQCKQAAWRQGKRDGEAKEARELARATGFRTNYEDGLLPGFGDDKEPAALVFNPRSTPLALAAAARARADCLHKSLDAWATVTESAVGVAEVASALEPIAQEVRLLLTELTARLQTAEAWRR